MKIKTFNNVRESLEFDETYYQYGVHVAEIKTAVGYIDMMSWCRKMFDGGYSTTHKWSTRGVTTISFRDEADRTLFLLRWSNE